MRAYSMDLRIRVVAAIDNGNTIEEVGEIFGVGKTFIKDLLKRRREKDSIAALPHAGGASRLIDEQTEQLIREKVKQLVDVTLLELIEYVEKKTKVKVSKPTMSRALKRMGLARKKKYRGNRKKRAIKSTLL
jgi:transposase